MEWCEVLYFFFLLLDNILVVKIFILLHKTTILYVYFWIVLLIKLKILKWGLAMAHEYPMINGSLQKGYNGVNSLPFFFFIKNHVRRQFLLYLGLSMINSVAEKNCSTDQNWLSNLSINGSVHNYNDTHDDELSIVNSPCMVRMVQIKTI